MLSKACEICGGNGDVKKAYWLTDDPDYYLGKDLTPDDTYWLCPKCDKSLDMFAEENDRPVLFYPMALWLCSI